MNPSPRVAVIVATVAMVASACGGSTAVAPSEPLPPTQAASAAPATSAPSPSQAPSPSYRVARMTVAGIDESSTPVNVTVDLPLGWWGDQYAADVHPYGPPAGIGFNLSVIDDTFADPCKLEPRDPKIGSTVAARVAALGMIPGVGAKAPVQTTLAGREATYVELTLPASLPCPPEQFNLWQDSPGGAWYAMGPNELWRVWILDVGGQAVAVTARSFPGTTDESNAELQQILDSMVFEG